MKLFHLEFSHSKFSSFVWIQLCKTFNNSSKHVLNGITNCRLSNLKGLKNAHATTINLSSTQRHENWKVKIAQRYSNIPRVNCRFLFTSMNLQCKIERSNLHKIMQRNRKLWHSITEAQSVLMTWSILQSKWNFEQLLRRYSSRQINARALATSRLQFSCRSFRLPFASWLIPFLNDTILEKWPFDCAATTTLHSVGHFAFGPAFAF